MKTKNWFRPRFAGFRGFVVRAPLCLVVSVTFASRSPAQCDPGQIWVPPQSNPPIYHPAVANPPIHHPAETHIEHTPAVYQHFDAVVVDHPAVTHIEFDEFENPYEVEDSPAWTEVISEAYDVEISPARDDVVVDVPAWDEPVPDTPAWEEPVPDTPGYCRDASWSGFDETSGWNPAGDWLPDASTIPWGDLFLRSRAIAKERRVGERSELGEERNVTTSVENDIESDPTPAVGTMVVWTDFTLIFDTPLTEWTPDPSTKPAGESFNQTRNVSRRHENWQSSPGQENRLVSTETVDMEVAQTNTGTLWTDFTEVLSRVPVTAWGPAENTKPEGTTYYKTRTVDVTRRTGQKGAPGFEQNVVTATTPETETDTVPSMGTGTGTTQPPGAVSIVGPPAGTGATSFWRDVNGDGILDEIITSTDPRIGLVLTVEDSGWEDDFSGHWTNWGARDGDRVFPTFGWSFETVVIPVDDNPWATLDIIFAPEPGRDYIVWSDDAYTYNNDASRWPAAVIEGQPRKTTADIPSGSATVTVPSQRSFLSALQRMSWYLIRIGKIDDELPADVLAAHSYTRTSAAPYGFSYLPASQELTREQLHTKVGELRGRGLNPEEIVQLDKNGCIALARIMMKRGQGPRLTGLPQSKAPEEVEIIFGSRSVWKIRAFISLEQTDHFECPTGHRELIFAKWGAWRNGVAPTPSANGEVPVNSVWGWDEPKHENAFNYVVLINGKWIGINHAVDPDPTTPQRGYVYNGPPQANFPEVPLIFIKVCIPE